MATRPVTLENREACLLLHLEETIGRPLALTLESTVLSSDLTIVTFQCTEEQEEALRVFLNLRRSRNTPNGDAPVGGIEQYQAEDR